MKRCLLLGLLFLLGGMVSGKAVSEVLARKVAMNWMALQHSGSNQVLQIEQVHPRKSDDRILAYLVCFEPRGWVLVAAANQVEPVLAYASEGKINPDQLPVQMNEWLDGIDREIIHSFSSHYQTASSIHEKWSTLSSEEPVTLKSAQAATHGPLLTCTWDQGRYYNEMAPYDPSSTAGNNHVWIGCVATAMAQLMHYWAYPPSGMGTNSYAHPDYGLQSADFENTIYQWESMPDHLNAEDTDVQQLNYHVAVSINMDFDPKGSGAYLSDARSALVQHFRYNSTLFESVKNYWEDQQWKTLLRNELNAGRPILYSGYTFSGASGHAFVCDGYSGEYFHFNWGWGGYANGNFLLSALNPGGTNYSYNQAAILGIVPVQLQPLQYPYAEGFESANAGQFVLTGKAALNALEKHSGNFSILLSEPDFSSQSSNSASLTFIVPADGQLSCWVKRHTPVISANNKQKAVLLTQHGETIVETLFDGDYNDADWVNYTTDLSAYAGHVLRLHFIQENNDVVKEQWMYIDDIVISGSGDNLVPFVPSSPVPANQQSGIELNPVLRWAGGDPNGNIVTYSVYFGKQPNPPLVGSVGSNSYQPETLDHSTKYYWRIVSSDGQLETSGPIWSFTTRNLPPDMGICGITELKAESASVCGKVISHNNSSIHSKGVCWDTVPSPTIQGNLAYASNAADNFQVVLSDLKPYTTYYVRSFAISDEGMAYSPDSVLKTLSAPAVLGDSRVELLNKSSVNVHAELLNVNDRLVSQYGVIWSLEPNVDSISGNMVIINDSLMQAGEFQVSLDELPGPALIHYRTFAVNSAGITHSAEKSFQTLNTAPRLLIDPDRSSNPVTGHFKSMVREQKLDGYLVDEDVMIDEPDGDRIVYAKILLKRKNGNEDGCLIYGGDQDGAIAIGNLSDSLMILAVEPLPAIVMAKLLRKVVLYILSDAPDVNIRHEIQIAVSDGMDWSEAQTAFLEVVPLNDAPVNLLPPALEGTASIGGQIRAIRGEWMDEADQTNCDFSYRYEWEKIVGNDTLVIEGANGQSLTIDSDLCNAQIRVHETLIDSGCGGAGVQVVSAQSEWLLIEKAAQTVVFDPIPVQQYRLDPYLLQGWATSSLPVNYGMVENPVAHLSADSVLFHGVGRIAVSCFQSGDHCYQAAEKVYRMLIVEKGVQEIVLNLPDSVPIQQGFLLLPAFSSAGLPLDIHSSKPHVAKMSNDTLYLLETGMVTLLFEQAGNANLLPAQPVERNIHIVKGQQLLSVNFSNGYQYGQDPIDLDLALQSDLPPIISLSDTSVLKINGHFLEIVGVGTCVVTIVLPGNEHYLPVPDQQITIEVTRGDQIIKVDLQENISFREKTLEYWIENSSGLPLTLGTSDSTVIRVEGDRLMVAGAGTATLSFANSGNQYWNEAEKKVSIEVIKGEQMIYCELLDSLVYGMAPLELSAWSDAGLPLTFVSSDTNVVSIRGKLLNINGAGEAAVIIYQKGDNNWLPTDSLIHYLQVQKSLQQINCYLNDTVYQGESYGFNQFAATSGMPVNIVASSDEHVADISNDSIFFTGSGEVVLFAEQSGNENYHAISSQFTVFVKGTVGFYVMNVPSFMLYPNPARQYFVLAFEREPEHPVMIRIFGTSGQVLQHFEIEERMQMIEIDHLPENLYFIELSGNGFKKIMKLLKH